MERITLNYRKEVYDMYQRLIIFLLMLSFSLTVDAIEDGTNAIVKVYAFDGSDWNQLGSENE